MKSISLIQAIVLLDEKDSLKKPVNFKSRKIDRLQTTPKSLALARKLAHTFLGRNLGDLPPQTKLLFLLIEKMEETRRAAKKIEYKDIQLETGWSNHRIKIHLNRLVTFHYIVRHDGKSGSQYELMHNSKSVSFLSVV